MAGVGPMWFKFPEGVTEISVQQMNFHSEFEDESGAQYFRAPDHFAHYILALPKFISVESMPEGAPSDLNPTDTLRDTTIGRLTAELSASKLEVEQLHGAIASFRAQNDDLKLALHNATEEIKNLKADLEESGNETEQKVGGKK